MQKTLTIVLFIFSFQQSFAQCNLPQIEKEAGYKIGKYIEIKSYSFDVHKLGSNKEIEYSYVLGKDKEYYFSLNNEKGTNPKIIITLYNSNKKAIASNYNEKTNTFNPNFSYKCPSTKMYYITFTIKDESTCAACVIGFKTSSDGKVKPQNW